jgi:hypothetical protein
LVELFKRYQQVACAAHKAVEFPNQHAVDLVVSARRIKKAWPPAESGEESEIPTVVIVDIHLAAW